MNPQRLSPAQISHGHERFLAQDPIARSKVEELTEAEADFLGMSLTDLRTITVSKALAERASQQGIDSFEYMLLFAIEDAHEREQFLSKRYQDIARAIGLEPNER